MSVVSVWPRRRSRRLDDGMAEDHRRPGRSRAWDAERIAEALVPRRDRLVDQLPRELAAARGLTRDQRELVIDEAIDYLVTEYAKPITDRELLERAFWATASFRVKRAHEGRGATVRAGWHRVDVDDVDIASIEGDPAAHVVQAVERGTLLEFAATLTEQERRVLGCKYGETTKEHGRRVVARRLGLPVPEVRRVERAIARKLERFVAIISAGSLCTHREAAIAAFAEGDASEQQEMAARIHLDHCPACKLAYVAHVKALRTGELQRRITQVLPLPAGSETTRRRGGPWEAVVDWATRPFASEATHTSAQLAAGARGIGAMATAKLASLCVGGVAAIGGATYCATTLLGADPPREQRPRAESPTPTPAPQTRREERPTLTVTRQASDRRATKPRQKRQDQPREQQPIAFSSGDPETRHEREAPVSPPVQVAGAQVSEFEPAPAEPVTQEPAAAPSTGAPEFP